MYKKIKAEQAELGLKQEKKHGEKEKSKQDHNAGEAEKDAASTDYRNKNSTGGPKEDVTEQLGKKSAMDGKQIVNKDEEADDKTKTAVTSKQDQVSGDNRLVNKKPIKKKITKKVVKGKVVRKKATLIIEVADAVPLEGMDAKEDCDKPGTWGNASQEDISAEIVKKNEEETEMKSEEQVQDDKEKVDEQDGPGTTVQKLKAKKTGKKKVIRRVIKRKVAPSREVLKAGGENFEAGKEDTKGQLEKWDVDLTERPTEDSKPLPAEKQISGEKKVKEENGVKNNILNIDKGGSMGSNEEDAKKKNVKKDGEDGKEKMKDEKEKTSKDSKLESKQKSRKEVKEKEKSNEPPKHPGLIMQAKMRKGLKIRSMSLSLDGLLDYNDKDIEESTFELSLFAESFNEMLQYQMGCRLLSVLEDGNMNRSDEKTDGEKEKPTAEDDNKESSVEDGKNNTEKKLSRESISKENKQATSEKVDPVKEEVVDKELLQAFRYFDRNKVGYIKVDDLRCIVHNLGKFLSNRDVKEMVHGALPESNSASGNRILRSYLISDI